MQPNLRISIWILYKYNQTKGLVYEYWIYRNWLKDWCMYIGVDFKSQYDKIKEI